MTGSVGHGVRMSLVAGKLGMSGYATANPTYIAAPLRRTSRCRRPALPSRNLMSRNESPGRVVVGGSLQPGLVKSRCGNV